MEKLKKTANVLDIILKVLFILTLVGLILLVVADVIMLAIGPMTIKNGMISYNVFGIDIVAGHAEELAGFNFNGYELVKAVLLASVSGVVGIAVVLFGIKMLREILAPMKVGGPFVEGISIKMRNFGIFVLVAGVAGSIIQGVMALVLRYYFFNALSLEEFIGSADQITYTYTFDGGFVLFALFIFLLSYIFKYGEELQKQSDETL